MDVIQKVADRHEPFEVFIRDGNAEAILGCDGEIEFWTASPSPVFLGASRGRLGPGENP